LPGILFMHQCVKYQEVVFEQKANYQRSSYFNRTYIAGANGKQRLTIPLKGGSRQKNMLKDICIDNSVKWQRIHWQAIQSAYAKSAYFEYYETELKQLYLLPINNLFQWNMSLVNLLLKLLNAEITYSFSTQYKKNIQPEIEFDMRNIICLNMDLSSSEYEPYYQVFQERNGFMSNLSVIDVLFSTGPDAARIIKNTKFRRI